MVWHMSTFMGPGTLLLSTSLPQYQPPPVQTKLQRVSGERQIKEMQPKVTFCPHSSDLVIYSGMAMGYILEQILAFFFCCTSEKAI